MCEQTPVVYKNGDIVWVKLGSCWWPGEVQDLDDLPADWLNDFKKPPLAAIKFFDEDNYEYVKSIDKIYSYNCSRKNEFIKKGLDLHKAKNAFMKKFPDDVVTAEKKTNGDPNIISDPIFTTEKKPNYASILFGSTPKAKRSSRKSTGSSKKSLSANMESSGSSPKVTPTRSITHPRFLGRDDHEVRILVQSPTRVENTFQDDSNYNCSTCGFMTSRIDVIVLHNKSHIQGVYSTPISSTRKSKKASPKRGKKVLKMAKSKTSSIMEDLALIEKGLFLTTESTDEEDVEDWDDELLPPRKRRKVKRKPKKPSVKKDAASPSKIDIRNNLLAEWEEDSEIEVDDVNLTTLSATAEDSDASVMKADESVQSTDTNDESTTNLEVKESNKSCFDFEEEDNEIVGTSVGRKIPRVLPPSKLSLSEAENEDSGLSDIVSCPSELIEEKAKDDKISVEQENVPSQFKDPDVEAFQDILSVTNVPSLPEVPHSLKFEQNFHDAKTIKFPDKSSTNEELNTLTADNDLSEKQSFEESTDELDLSKGFKPKKKCILEMEVDDVVRPSVEELTDTLSKQDVEVEIAPMSDLTKISETNSQNKDSSRSELKLEVKDKLAIVNKFGSDDSNNEVPMPSSNKSPVKESTTLSSKLINPKKRFVKSFEDFEQQLNNEQRKLMESETLSSEELSIVPVELKATDDTDKIVPQEKSVVVEDLEIKGSGVEFSKLKTQLKTKLESSDTYQSEALKPKKERTSEKRKHRDNFELKTKSKQAKYLDAMLYDDHSTGEDSLQELIVAGDSHTPFEVQEKEDTKMSEASVMDDMKFEYSENCFEDKNTSENVNLELDIDHAAIIQNSNILEISEPSIALQTNQVVNEDLDLLSTSPSSVALESDQLTKEDCELQTTESTGSAAIDETIADPDFDIKNDSDDLSALSALAAVSELSTSLTVQNEDSEDKAKIINQDLGLIESEESKLIEGNMTFFTESDLVNSQVEIANLSPIKEKCKPVTLSNFSVDFTDSEEKDILEKAPPTSDETSKTKSKLRESDNVTKEGIVDFKSEFQSSDSSASEENISNLSPIYSQNTATTVPDYGNSKLLDILSEGKEQDFRQKLANERSHSKVEHMSHMSSLFNKEFSKTVPRCDSKNTKFMIKSGTTEKLTSPSNKSGKPIILSNKIIKSTPDIETISVQKIPSKKTNQGFDDNIDAFIIKKPIKRTIVQEDDSIANMAIIKKQPAYRGKAKILQQTIIKPTGDIVASSMKTSSIDDNMFDINSMPIVLGDQILTEDCIENMPVVLSDSVQSSTTKINTSLITKPHGTQMKLLNKPISSPSSSKVLLKTYASQKVVKSPRIYQPNPTKPIKSGPTIISRPSKPDKFIIVPPSSNSNTPTPSKYTVGKKTIIKKAQPVVPAQTGSTARIASSASEPTGNKIMIVTNQQGQQSRVLLTPAQQKILGYQTTGTKLVKNTLKGNILQKTTLKGSTNPKVSSVLSHAIINSMGSVVSPNQNLIISDGQKLVPIRPHQTKISKAEISKPLKKIQMPSQKVVLQEGYNTSKVQQKTIVIQNKLGQVIKKIQGSEDTLLEQQVAENLQAIKASGSFSTGKSKLETIGASKSRAPLVKRPSYFKRVSSTEIPTKSTPHKMQVVPTTTNIVKQKIETSLPPLTPISPKKIDNFPQPPPKIEEPKIESMDEGSSKQDQVQPKPPNQLIIQDSLGNQTTITEGQILALPSGDTVDGQPQSYMLVTLDESGNLAPLNNEALLSLDPNLCLGADLSNMVLQVDDGPVSAKKDDTIKPEEELLTKTTSQETSSFESENIKIDQTSDNSEKLTPVTKELTCLDNISHMKVDNSDESVLSTYESTAETSQGSLDSVQTVTCNIGSDSNQQLIITGDPVSTQKFIESLTEGNQDLANLLASAEGNILIHTDEQQILINTDANNQILLPMNSDSLNVSESHGNPMFATQSNKNQDILAAALADTDVFQSEPSTQTKMGQSQLSPSGGLYPSGVANVLGTTLSLSSPIMTPLEVPSCNNKKIPDEESNLLITEVPKNVDLPITITDPNISQTVAQQRVASLIVNELTSNLDLPLNITESGVPLTSAEMNSSSFVYSLPSLDDSVDIHQKAFSEPISMPLLTEDHHNAVHEELSSGNTNLDLNSPNTESNLLLSVSTSEKEENVQSTSQSFLTLETEGLCTLGGAMCSSLSEPPPDMFDLSLVTSSNYVTESEIKEHSTESTSTTITCNVSDNITTFSSQQESPKSSIEISSNDQTNELDTYDSESRNVSTPLSSLPLNSESNSPAVNLDENSCEIPVQPRIVADLNLPTFENNETTDTTYFSSNKRLNTESKFENEEKKAKLD